MEERPYEREPEARPPAQPAAPPAADEQLTVPEDREAAAEADRSATAGRGPQPAGAGPGPEPQAPRPSPSDTDGFQLYSRSDVDDYRRRWDALQSSFVDDPRDSAQRADDLIGELVDRANRRRLELREELGRHSDTEAMRLAMRRYRQLFHTLIGG